MSEHACLGQANRQVAHQPLSSWSARQSPCVDVQNFYQDVEFDGLWLDMDEVSNYCTGDVCQNPGEVYRSRLSDPSCACLEES